MVKKTIKYTDYNGVEITEDFYFSLNKAEVAKLELEHPGGLSNKIKSIVDKQETHLMVKLFEEFLLLSHGIKSEDGKRFVKSDEIRENFKNSAAYPEIFYELASNEESAKKFFEGIIPKMPADVK